MSFRAQIPCTDSTNSDVDDCDVLLGWDDCFKDDEDWGSGVFRTTLTRKNATRTHPNETVVAKLAFDTALVARLEREAGLYQSRLRELQGAVVTEFHGLYNVGDAACMLLEDCGERIHG